MTPNYERAPFGRAEYLSTIYPFAFGHSRVFTRRICVIQQKLSKELSRRAGTANRHCLLGALERCENKMDLELVAALCEAGASRTWLPGLTRAASLCISRNFFGGSPESAGQRHSNDTYLRGNGERKRPEDSREELLARHFD